MPVQLALSRKPGKHAVRSVAGIMSCSGSMKLSAAAQTCLQEQSL
jgi:hypothetical protein